MRIIGIIIGAVVVFIAALLVPLALTGKLNADTFKRLAGMEAKPAATKGGAPAAESGGALASKSKEEQERLAKWRDELQQQADDLDRREQHLNEMLAEVSKKTDELEAAQSQKDAEAQAATLLTAKTVEKMDPTEAAKVFEKMEPDDAARIAALISDRIRGAIFDAIKDPQKRVDILKALQAKKS